MQRIRIAGSPLRPVKTNDAARCQSSADRDILRRFAGSKEWRVPVVPELAPIVEMHCFNPRVNTDVFPGMPSAPFWTSMEKIGAQQYAYTLDFGGGSAGPTLRTSDGSLRLVRGGPWWTPPPMP